MGDEEAVTRVGARAGAAAWAHDASTVAELVYDAFNADAATGGFAFTCDRGVYVAGADGSKSWSVDPGSEEARLAFVEEFWAAARHRDRAIDPQTLGGAHRAAIATLVGGLASVSELPSGERAAFGVADDQIPNADYVYVHLARHAREHTEAAALRAFAANDWLLTDPTAVHQRAHACPLCGNPALGGPRYLTAVCDDCYPRTACRHARTIAGNNTSLSGGFEARHVDDDSVCEQATTDHRCWIGVRECRIAEAYMGGVVVTARTKEDA